MKKQNIPKVRFSGFDGEWRQIQFENFLSNEEGVRRGPFGSALKKEFFVDESEYTVYEQQNAIYDRFDTRYYVNRLH